MSAQNLENFPERLDAMLEHVSKVYFGQDNFEDLFKDGTDLQKGKVGQAKEGLKEMGEGKEDGNLPKKIRF